MVRHATRRIKKTCLTEYCPGTNGVNAININDDDRVISVPPTARTKSSYNRKWSRHPIQRKPVRTMGRNATGVRRMVLDGGDDEVVGMVCVNDKERETGAVVSEQGYGKQTGRSIA